MIAYAVTKADFGDLWVVRLAAPAPDRALEVAGPRLTDVAAAILTDAGATVYATHSVADAIARVAIERPDAVVSDLQMPGLSGWEFIKLLHHDAPGLPVIVVSGYIDERMRAMHQPDGVVSKPYRASTLVNTVRQVVARRTARSSEASGPAA